MIYHQKYFQENEFKIENKKIKCYLSPNLVKNNFKHGFFSKLSYELHLDLLSKQITSNNRNFILNQIHSNKIVPISKIKEFKRLEADGMICDMNNQNLWIYTADCMPIFFADKMTRNAKTLYFGRKGLEKK